MTHDLVLSYLRDAPQGDGYSTEDLALLIHELSFSDIDAEEFEEPLIEVVRGIRQG